MKSCVFLVNATSLFMAWSLVSVFTVFDHTKDPAYSVAALSSSSSSMKHTSSLSRPLSLGHGAKKNGNENDNNIPQTNHATTAGATTRARARARANQNAMDRRSVFGTVMASSASLLATSSAFVVSPAYAVGPVKLDLASPTSYVAAPCPPSKPIPGEKAMKGMRGLCVTVEAELKTPVPRDLKDVGVYGFVIDGDTGNSVLANNPDLSTDAGQFSMVDSITPNDKKVTFEFVAAVPKDKDLSKFENGIGELNFESLRVISYPGGQQYGAISPCEMNEFSSECEEWEEANGKFVRGDYMIKSNPRTKGR